MFLGGWGAIGLKSVLGIMCAGILGIFIQHWLIIIGGIRAGSDRHWEILFAF